MQSARTISQLVLGVLVALCLISLGSMWKNVSSVSSVRRYSKLEEDELQERIVQAVARVMADKSYPSVETGMLQSQINRAVNTAVLEQLSHTVFYFSYSIVLLSKTHLDLGTKTNFEIKRKHNKSCISIS